MKEHIYTEAVALLRKGGVLGSFLSRLNRFVETDNSAEAKAIGDWLPVLNDIKKDGAEIVIMDISEIASLLPVLTHFLGVTKIVTPKMGLARLENVLRNEFHWEPIRKGHTEYGVKL